MTVTYQKRVYQSSTTLAQNTADIDAAVLNSCSAIAAAAARTALETFRPGYATVRLVEVEGNPAVAVAATVDCFTVTVAGWVNVTCAQMADVPYE